MKDETLMLLSMKDSKKVANAMSNETAQKIISYLVENKEATESELANKLNAPLPTIHYNIQQLKNAKLITTKAFFWSKKGKKMPLYQLAKKYIIISPDTSKNNLSKLKTLLPVAILSIFASGAIFLFNKTKSFAGGTEKMMADVAISQGYNYYPYQDVCHYDATLALTFLAGSFFVIIVAVLLRLLERR